MTAAPYAATAEGGEPSGKSARRCGVGLWGLAALTTFTLGGLVALELVHQLLVGIMARLIASSAQGEILNVLDHLLPYRLGVIALSLLLTLGTAGAFALDALANTLRSRAAAQR